MEFHIIHFLQVWGSQPVEFSNYCNTIIKNEVIYVSEQEWLDIFSENMSELMKEQGYTQKELAYDSGLPEGSISYYLRGLKIPTIKSALKLAHVFNISLDDFIDFGSDID